MEAKRKLVGREVPIPGSDSLTWIEIIVPSSPVSTKAAAASASTSKSSAPPTEDRAWCFSNIYDYRFPHLICRINKSLPNVLEVLELYPDKEFPSNGLRVVFPDALLPCAFMRYETNRFRTPYMLCAVTVSGVAYLVHLKSANSYPSSSIIPANEFVGFDVRPPLAQGVITTVAADTLHLIVGTSSGSVTTFRIGFFNSIAFQEDLQDNTITGKPLRPKNKTVGAVRDLEVLDTPCLAFVLYSDGTVRVWHLGDHSRLLSYKVHKTSSEGMVYKRLWIDRTYGYPSIRFAILHKRKLEDSHMQTISLYSIRVSYRDFPVAWMDSAARHIPLEGECRDVQFSRDHILILKDGGVVSYDINHKRAKVLEDPGYYALHEEFVADQLLQSFEHFPDDLFSMTGSSFSSTEDKKIPLVGLILLRKLLYPVISDDGVFEMTVDGLKKELLLLIEQEAHQGPLSASCRWKGSRKRYFENRCDKNAPLGLFSHGDVVLIRKSSVAFCRSVNKIERLVAGLNEVSDIETIGLSSFTDKDGQEILVKVLGCVNCISQKLGKVGSAVIYELFIGTSVMNYDDSFPCLRTEYSATTTAFSILDSGPDVLLNEELMYHKNLKEFSASMLSSLQNLRDRAVTWGRVLDVVEGYVNLLVPNKTRHKFDTTRSLDTKTSVIAVSASQIARVMFESAIDVLLFLGFVLDIGGKIHLSGDDASRIQFKLVPRLRTIIAQWLTIDFFASAPFESLNVEDFRRQVSSSKIDASTDKILCKDQLGRGNPELVLLSNYSKWKNWRSPPQEIILEAAGELISRIIWGRTGDGCCISMSHTAELATTLIRNGRHNLAKLLVGSTESLPRKQFHSRSPPDAKDEWRMLVAERLPAQARGLDGSPKDAKAGPGFSRSLEHPQLRPAHEWCRSLWRKMFRTRTCNQNH